jgi:hypothetical protein
VRKGGALNCVILLPLQGQKYVWPIVAIVRAIATLFA